MESSFWFGNRISDFLFENFSTYTLPGFISICAGLLALAVFYELLVVYQISLKQSSGTWKYWRNELAHNSFQSREMFFAKLKQTLLFTAQVLVSYILMLSVMTFNGYFTGSIVIGGGLGYFLLANSVYEMKIFDISDNCADSGDDDDDEDGPSDLPRRHHSADVMKNVAEEISDSLNDMICEAVVERVPSVTTSD